MKNKSDLSSGHSNGVELCSKKNGESCEERICSGSETDLYEAAMEYSEHGVKLEKLGNKYRRAAYLAYQEAVDLLLPEIDSLDHDCRSLLIQTLYRQAKLCEGIPKMDLAWDAFAKAKDIEAGGRGDVSGKTLQLAIQTRKRKALLRKMMGENHSYQSESRDKDDF